MNPVDLNEHRPRWGLMQQRQVCNCCGKAWPCPQAPSRDYEPQALEAYAVTPGDLRDDALDCAASAASSPSPSRRKTATGMIPPGTDLDDDALSEDDLRQAISAVLHGAVWRGFDGPDGVSKDEALEYAAILARWVEVRLDGGAP